MKALEILKDIRNIETEYNHLKKHRFDQAIEELEDLKNRSCDSCMYVGKSNCINCLSCKRQYSDNWRNK